ncbi:MAG: phenylalanine--tRNA ligase subunit beta [Flavobacteriales bacterium]|jgi:phenylalanyl-tRNA synthetase beta chain|nr:phenylalanine--tRNA ligase subunit beta [Flavobacteriales bacterium]
MRISWNWLKQYVAPAEGGADLTPHEAAAILTSTGLEVESVEPFEPVKGMLAGVVTGHVLERAKHPDADRLSLCLVDIGTGEPQRIVCGAPNVAAGQKVLVATIGTVVHLPDGTSFTIKKSKIRGQESHGMICAEDELGLGDGHDGIMVLPPESVVGTPAAELLGLTADQVLEIGLTPNRTDAMGHLGVARDLVAAIAHRTGRAPVLRTPSVDAYAQDRASEAAVQVDVQAPHAALRYAGITLADVRVGPSPKWMQDRLLAIGLKPINNVVDVTNYVQHELGQPLHAFDADKLQGGRIVVRMAAAGEPFTALDGKAHTLDAGDLVIADAQVPVCIAGVFGGLHSGVTEGTATVFLESACFEPGHVRRTARRHGLHTDASFRFERGVDPSVTVYALMRAALLLKETAGAQVVSGITDIGVPPARRAVDVTFAEVEHLAGTAIAPDEAVRILELLEFAVLHRDDQGVRVAVPASRADVHRPADVIEELLRIHGYDRVPMPAYLKLPSLPQPGATLETLRRQSGQHLAARGMHEVMTPSLVNGARCVRSGIATADQLVTLANPLSSELDVMRPTMLFGMLGAVAHNLNRQRKDLAFFERGRIYRTAEDDARETETLGLALTGRRFRENWRSPTRKADLFDLREELELLLERCGVREMATWEPVEHALLGHAHALMIDGRRAGVLGEVRASVLKAAEVGQPVLFAEVDEEVLLAACAGRPVRYAEVPRFPAVRRDLSLLVDQAVRFAELRALAFAAERKLLRAVGLFDVYQGKADGPSAVPAGRKSYALSFVLQDEAKTLTDEQVDKAMGRIRKALEGAGAELRGA